MWHLSQRTLSVIYYFYKMNIKITYLYRDAANYKSWNEEVFSNTSDIPLEKIKTVVHSLLQDGEYFNAKEWGLKDLHFENWDEEIDHAMHELHCIEETSFKNTTIDIAVFLSQISCIKIV